MAHHRTTNARLKVTSDRVWVTFDCSCGVTDDVTTGRSEADALERADQICRDHAATIPSRTLGVRSDV